MLSPQATPNSSLALGPDQLQQYLGTVDFNCFDDSATYRTKTKMGKAMRAVSVDSDAAQL